MIQVTALSGQRRLKIRGMNTFQGGDNSVKSVPPSFWWVVISKNKDQFWKERITSRGIKFFPYRDDPFSEGSLRTWKRTGSNKSCIPLQKWRTSYQVYLVNVRYSASFDKHPSANRILSSKSMSAMTVWANTCCLNFLRCLAKSRQISYSLTKTQTLSKSGAVTVGQRYMLLQYALKSLRFSAETRQLLFLVLYI